MFLMKGWRLLDWGHFFLVAKECVLLLISRLIASMMLAKKITLLTSKYEQSGSMNANKPTRNILDPVVAKTKSAFIHSIKITKICVLLVYVSFYRKHITISLFKLMSLLILY